MLRPIGRILVVNRERALPAFIKYNIASLIWMIVLAFLMLMPSESIPDVKLFSYDKLGHMGVFCILYLLLVYGFSKQGLYLGRKNKLRIAALTISIVYSATLEFLQKFIPGRAFDIYDIIANTTGIFVGLIIFSVFSKK